jgi:hypothetical protein
MATSAPTNGTATQATMPLTSDPIASPLVFVAAGWG